MKKGSLKCLDAACKKIGAEIEAMEENFVAFENEGFALIYEKSPNAFQSTLRVIPKMEEVRFLARYEGKQRNDTDAFFCICHTIAEYRRYIRKKLANL